RIVRRQRAKHPPLCVHAEAAAGPEGAGAHLSGVEGAPLHRAKRGVRTLCGVAPLDVPRVAASVEVLVAPGPCEAVEALDRLAERRRLHADFLRQPLDRVGGPDPLRHEAARKLQRDDVVLLARLAIADPPGRIVPLAASLLRTEGLAGVVVVD